MKQAKKSAVRKKEKCKQLEGNYSVPYLLEMTQAKREEGEEGRDGVGERDALLFHRIESLNST